MKYFAYGSNMNPERMRERGIDFSERVRAILEGWRLEFNKVASRNPEEGYANIVKDDKEIVEGILYTVFDSDIKKLDRYEGYPCHYNRITVIVKLNDGKEREAITYVANSEKVRDGLKPSREYLNHLLERCDLLSQEYCEKLKRKDTFN